MAIYNGTNGPDRYTAPRNQPNEIYGFDGNDTLTGGDRGDLIFGGTEGSDVIQALAGNDTVRPGDPFGQPADRNRVDLGAGDDLVFLAGEIDAVIGGSGSDTISYIDADSAVGIDLARGRGLSGGARGDTFTGVEGAVGSDFNDVLVGSTGNNVLDGGDGRDQLSGGRGNDTLTGGRDADRIDGGAGFDFVSFSDAGFDVVVNLGRGRGLANDALGDTYVGIEGVVGSDFFDTLIGSTGANVLEGGGAADQLTGGGGADRFVLSSLADSTVSDSGRDIITDFSTADDRIDVSGIDARTGVAGNQAFAFIGRGEFTGAAGQLRFAQVGGDTIVYGDVNGDRRADFAVELDGRQALTAGDFIL